MPHRHPAAALLVHAALLSIGALALSTASMASPAQSSAAEDSTRCATVEVQGVRPQQGQLMVAAYASAETWRKRPQAALQVPAGDATLRFELCGLAGEEVAITLFQDLDSDGRMATNFVGMPTEPWGASGRPGAMGPNWDRARVALDGSVIVVRLSQ